MQVPYLDVYHKLAGPRCVVGFMYRFSPDRKQLSGYADRLECFDLYLHYSIKQNRKCVLEQFLLSGSVYLAPSVESYLTYNCYQLSNIRLPVADTLIFPYHISQAFLLPKLCPYLASQQGSVCSILHDLPLEKRDGSFYHLSLSG